MIGRSGRKPLRSCRAVSLRAGSTFGHLPGMGPNHGPDHNASGLAAAPLRAPTQAFCPEAIVIPSCKLSGAPVARISLAVAVAAAPGRGMRAPAIPLGSTIARHPV